MGRADEGPGWQVWNWGPECPWDEPLKARFNAVFRDVDTILLSRKILEGGYLDHWSQFARDYGDNPDFAFAQRIVDARKVVFSRTLQMTKWAGTELALRPLVEEVDALKAESERDFDRVRRGRFYPGLSRKRPGRRIPILCEPGAAARRPFDFPRARRRFPPGATGG